MYPLSKKIYLSLNGFVNKEWKKQELDGCKSIHSCKIFEKRVMKSQIYLDSLKYFDHTFSKIIFVTHNKKDYLIASTQDYKQTNKILFYTFEQNENGYEYLLAQKFILKGAICDMLIVFRDHYDINDIVRSKTIINSQNHEKPIIIHYPLACYQTNSFEAQKILVGMDKHIASIDLNRQTVDYVYENASPASTITVLRTIEFGGQLACLIADYTGTIRLTDLKENMAQKENVGTNFRTKKLGTGDFWAASCIETYPTNGQQFVTGHVNGSIHFWDLRRNDSPLQSIEDQHDAFVSAVKFHPIFPNKALFTSSHDHSLLSWLNNTDSSFLFTTNTYNVKDDQPPITIQNICDGINCFAINDMTFSGDGNLLFGATEGQSLITFDISQHIQLV